VNEMGEVMEKLKVVMEELNKIPKAQLVFTTDIGGKVENWNKTFQFNLSGEDPFHLIIQDKIARVVAGEYSNPDIIMEGDPNAIVKICEGKGDFTHAISREEIQVVKGKVMDIIRLTRAITIVLKTK